MLAASTVYGIEVYVRESQRLSSESVSGFNTTKYLLESVVIGAYRKAISFKIRVKVGYRPYDSKAFAFCCIVSLFTVRERWRPLPVRFCRFVRLILQEDTADSDVVCVCV